MKLKLFDFLCFAFAVFCFSYAVGTVAARHALSETSDLMNLLRRQIVLLEDNNQLQQEYIKSLEEANRLCVKK